MPRPVRGNSFNVAVTVVARRIDGTVIDDFALTSEAVLNITHGTSSTQKEYTIIGHNMAVIHFDGTDAAGIYGVEFTGEWNDEPWRFAVPVVFQIVELTTQGWLPKDGIIYEPTYEVDAEIVIAGGGDVQADWTETDPDSPAYIKNKPADILEGTEIIECNITAVDSSDRATVDNANWVNDAVAAYNAKKIPVLFGSVSSGVYYAMPLVVQPYENGGVTDYKVYGSAAVNLYLGAGQFKQSILYAQAQTTHGGHSIYVTDFQDKLVSGQNIKTINGQSIVGSGNVEIPTGLSAAYEVVDAGLLYLDQTNTYYEVPATVYTALKAVWDAGKVPVLKGNLDGLESNMGAFATTVSLDNSVGAFRFFAHNSNPGRRTSNFSSWGKVDSEGGRVYTTEEYVVVQTVQAGSTNPVSGAGVKTYVDGIVGDINTILDEINGEVI